ncbi:hypothetical protein KFK09_020808 [Dendrobium nobile]|uniref:Uncharacterized protein n=1 Tax=Dendrobium nobile TaxID=94219 RepID=A0A8T3AMW9_DENNO|nr:hypothetical protein KFK09_020808 [Dendrobium nobile]
MFFFMLLWLPLLSHRPHIYSNKKWQCLAFMYIDWLCLCWFIGASIYIYSWPFGLLGNDVAGARFSVVMARGNLWWWFLARFGLAASCFIAIFTKLDGLCLALGNLEASVNF